MSYTSELLNHILIIVSHFLSPVVKYLPEWFPGAGFKKLARSWAEQFEEFRGMPFIATKEAVVSGTECERV